MDRPFRNSRRKLSQGLLFWREVGEGTPIVLLHGAWNDSSEWVTTMELLSNYAHCFAPDLLGYGESENPEVHYSIDLQVESLAEFLQALKLEKVYLVGHSLGGWIAASYAVKYPERVSGLVLIAPLGVGIEGIEKRLAKERRIFKRGEGMYSLIRFLSPILKIFGIVTKIDEEWRLRQLWLEYPTSCQLLFQRRNAEIQAELLDGSLFSIEAPLLVLQGGKDEPERLKASQTYANLASKGDIKIIAHAQGDLPSSNSPVVAGEIRDFIKVEIY